MCEACRYMVNHNQRLQSADIERLLDRRIWERLASDPAYRNAENAEEQRQREDEIEREEAAKLGIPYED